MEASKRKNDALQRVANNLMLRLYIKEQEQQPARCHVMDCCRLAPNNPYLQRTDVGLPTPRPAWQILHGQVHKYMVCRRLRIPALLVATLFEAT